MGATRLEKELGKYAYRKWTYEWEPKTKGEQTIMVIAINKIGKIRPLADEIGWSAGGYQYNVIDSASVRIVQG